MSKWPKDNQAALIRFYGDPGKKGAVTLVKVIPPFKMYYDGKQVTSLSFHKKAAPALRAALNQVWEYYGRDQAKIDALGISKTAGTYNPRKVRGSKTKWSNHAYGAAIDINAEENGFNVAGNIPLPMIAAFKAQGFKWGGDYKSRKDPMHFELVDSGEPERTFEQWLDFYKVPRRPAPVIPAATVDPDVRGDPEIWHVQRRLKALNYNPGGLDGIWGGNTAGAIAGFVNDRAPKFAAPTSDAAFRKVLPQLKSALAKAEADHVMRPVSVERAATTTTELAKKRPDVAAAKQSERVGFWASVTGFIGTAASAVVGSLGDAVEWLTPLKTFAGDVPWWVWIIGALLGSGLIYFISKKAGDAGSEATKAFQEGKQA